MSGNEFLNRRPEGGFRRLSIPLPEEGEELSHREMLGRGKL